MITLFNSFSEQDFLFHSDMILPFKKTHRILYPFFKITYQKSPTAFKTVGLLKLKDYDNTSVTGVYSRSNVSATALFVTKPLNVFKPCDKGTLSVKACL